MAIFKWCYCAREMTSYVLGTSIPCYLAAYGTLRLRHTLHDCHASGCPLYFPLDVDDDDTAVVLCPFAVWLAELTVPVVRVFVPVVVLLPDVVSLMSSTAGAGVNAPPRYVLSVVDRVVGRGVVDVYVGL